MLITPSFDSLAVHVVQPYTVGDTLYADTVTSIAKLPFVPTATRYLANTGGGATIPAWDFVNMANGVSGILGVANGGTGHLADWTANGVLYASAAGTLANSVNLLFTNNGTATLSEFASAGNISSGAFFKLPATTNTVGQVLQYDIPLASYVRFIHSFVWNDGVNTPSYRNLFIGIASGNTTTIARGTQNNQGTGNVGIGYNTLNYLTTGYFNFGLGNIAGEKITTGFSNVLIGHSAANNMSTGGYNICIGETSGGRLTTSCFDNTYIGAYAGFANQTGDDNICIGHLVGWSAAASAYSASKNTLIGSQCAYYLQASGGNIYLGATSGYYQTTTANLLIITNTAHGGVGAPTDNLNAIIYGTNLGTVANQTLVFNAQTTVGNGTTSQPLTVTGLTTASGGLSNSSKYIGKVTVATDTYVVLTTDETVTGEKATAFAITLFPAVTAIIGQRIIIKNLGAGAITITADATGTADLIDGVATLVIYQWESAQLVCTAADKWSVI